jgi:sugar/nucleoside kinase (ribokinase family)
MIDFVAIGSIIIDDIIDPQGRSTMGALGGGGAHAVAGMRVWREQVALVAIIGQNFPESAWRHLDTLAYTGGVLLRDTPQPRAWQLFETDGARREVFRTDFAALRQTAITPAEYPAQFASAQGVYLQTGSVAEAEAWAVRLKQLNPATILLWEPWEIIYTPENWSEFGRVASLFDIVSPQTVEVSWMMAETNPERQAARLIEAGVRCLALRSGAAGSWVCTAAETHHIPALSVPVVDETGAGNAYCGGFIVGYVESGGDPLMAGQYGTVSATFALAQVGLPRLGPTARITAEEKLKRFHLMTYSGSQTEFGNQSNQSP